jgi:hypothetical protein
MHHVLESKQYELVSILSVFEHPYLPIAITTNAYTFKKKEMKD